MAISHVFSNALADVTGTITGFNSQGSTTTIAATNLVRPSNWNSVHNQFYTLSGNTANASTASGTNVVFQASGQLTLAGSTGTIVLVAPSLTTQSGAIIAPVEGRVPAASSVISAGQNSVLIFPCRLDSYVSADHLRLPVSVQHASSAAASVQRGHTIDVGIYSRNATNATVLTLHYSTNYTIAASHNSNVSWMLSIITAIGNSTSYNSLTASSAGVNLSSSLGGLRELIAPISSVLSSGEWWWALRESSSSAGAAGNVLNISHVGVAHQTFNRIGVASASSNSAMYGPFLGMGAYSVTSGALPAGISFTQINNMGSLPLLFLATGTV